MEHVKLGLRENKVQFALLVLVNAFIGGMLGMERTIVPQFAELVFGIESKTAILSFIAAFGISKALSNYAAGRLSNSIGRKNLLVSGWILALPIPFILIHAQDWNWVIFANVLLGISQGLAWSSTIVMKIDLVGEKNRGFAVGLSEFAGYGAIGVVAFLSSYIADVYGITPYPFYLGIFISIIGLALSIFWVKDTRIFVNKEIKTDSTPGFKNVFLKTTFKHKTLSSVTQAGVVNNLNDGMMWGLFPIMLVSLKFDTVTVGLITAIYPTIWGLGQLFTGKLSDHFSKKKMLFYGMIMQGLAILCIPFFKSFWIFVSISAILGLGTALVYPTFLSTVAQVTNPSQRAESIGTFRLWRDFGYAFGAILSGLTTDFFGINYAFILIGILTLTSGFVIQIRMPKM